MFNKYTVKSENIELVHIEVRTTISSTPIFVVYTFVVKYDIGAKRMQPISFVCATVIRHSKLLATIVDVSWLEIANKSEWANA